MDTTYSDGKPKKEKAIVIFQGGAALAAYECGAFESIATEMDKHGEELAVVGGTSSGGLNAAIIAKSYRQHQGAKTGAATATAEDLKTFWTTVLPNPSPSFFPPYPGLQFPLADITLRFLNFGLLLFRGNPHMFTPDLSTLLSPLAPAHYSASAAEKLLKEQFGAYEGCDPRLILTATNVQSGRLEAFDSGKNMITPAMIVACGTFPGLVPAKEIEGEYYWDGGAWTNTPLGAVMNTLMSASCDGQTSAKEPIPTYKVYIVNGHPQQSPLPQDSIAVLERMWDILVGDKTAYDIKFSERLNKHIELVQLLHKHFDKLPKEVKPEVKRAYQEIAVKKKWAILHFVPLQRGSLSTDLLAGEWDFSLSRINELIAQGKRETQKQLEDRESLQEEYDAQIESLQEEIESLQAALAT